MFKFIFDLATEPLGLPIEWYQEWIILGIIGVMVYDIAYKKVGNLYRAHAISGRVAGSFFHWIIRAACFIGLWAITYGIIWIGKFAIENKVLVSVIVGIVFLIFITVKLLLWNWRRKEMLKVSMQNTPDEKEE